jgi:hypothetical protein
MQLLMIPVARSRSALNVGSVDPASVDDLRHPERLGCLRHAITRCLHRALTRACCHAPFTQLRGFHFPVPLRPTQPKG